MARAADVDVVALFETSLKELLKGRGFQLRNDITKESQLAASQMLEWLSDNRAAAHPLLYPLVCMLEDFLRGLSLGKKSGREKMWGKFHLTRTSKEFLASWAVLMKNSLEKKTAPPLFYQHMTEILFRSLIKLHTPVEGAAQQSLTKAPNLTYEEENALYFIAGYVIRETKKKLSKKPNSSRDTQALDQELNLCLVELADDFEDSDEPSASDWTGEINRGGLSFVNNPTYQLFYSMEMAVQQELTQQTAPSITSGFKSEVIKKIHDHEDVVFHWSIVSADWEKEVAELLLGMIVELWVTVRGFAFACHWMEGYKQRQRKSTQKSKGVRKQLIGRSTDNQA